MIPVSPISSIVHNSYDTYSNSFLVANKRGVYAISLKDNRVVQNFITDIVQDLEVKYLIHDRLDAFLIYPKWEKQIKRVCLSAHSSKYSKGVTNIYDIEWTKGSVSLPGFNPERADWHVGFSGSSIFLNDMLAERSYVLKTDLTFNYWCDL